MYGYIVSSNTRQALSISDEILITESCMKLMTKIMSYENTLAYNVHCITTDELESSFKHAEMADLCLSCGSSLTVTPAADIPQVLYVVDH